MAGSPGPRVVPPGTNFLLVSTLPIQQLFLVKRPAYEVSAEDFLKFAVEDLHQTGSRGRANALTNAKRAISNRVDSLLYGCGLRGFAQKARWNFPERVRHLQEIGYPAPGVLHNLPNRKRNLLEHEYAIPSAAEEVQDMIDIGEMFLQNTKRFVDRGWVRACLRSSTPINVDLVAIRHPPKDGDVLEFDLDTDTVACYSSWGAFSPTPLRDIGEELVIDVAKEHLHALENGTANVVTYPTEEEFIQHLD
jgi:hypothetical protein